MNEWTKEGCRTEFWLCSVPVNIQTCSTISTVLASIYYSVPWHAFTQMLYLSSPPLFFPQRPSAKLLSNGESFSSGVLSSTNVCCFHTVRNTLSSQLAQFKSHHVGKGSLLTVKTDMSYFAFFMIPVPVNRFLHRFSDLITTGLV